MTTTTDEQPDEKVFELWCWPQVFQRILDGLQTFDVRKDLGQMPGDVMYYREKYFEQGKEPHYTGRELHARVRYVYHGSRTDEHVMPRRENPVLQGYVVMAIKVQKPSIKHAETTTTTGHGTERAAA